ncbi:PTS system transcriptional activator [Tepidanaerobacter acetatoxydans Re1]|uniref:PTS system transcriptional activator n=1 Tax=Tepidanaerobacter acetatoxydans (strain DSM 21804 / JCM 16047 / Re1) TaxID=1209989 RepID=F4LWW4_TEPAE|nr:sigma-54-dependent transcriptional regulator [Tepidanaerobacter acetatoxydans]AEE91836.1 PTS system transcriptional activator [Tepidanaerobacter acetatoxydans Re1]CDI40825.1 PTS system transcriptional activator [Tepidanaerobacter acetatoxydans Re1]
MMTRKEKVFIALKNLSSDVSAAKIAEDLSFGFDAETISKVTEIDRSNVSRELNELVRENKAIKIIGRPVKFFAKSCLEEILQIKYEGDGVIEDVNNFLHNTNFANDELNTKENDPFARIIGETGSLELAIKQAKAAILYPPRGLHTLITGPTGVGKTTFAEVMYQYAIYNGNISKDAELIVFNCSEYADNPQLILSQLFGYVKGAFTGANQDKAGLIESADGGILLLDEIHRLPPEAQEMLFLLMDKGIYRRLGETDKYHTASILIIGATTENLNSVLLQTFLRRIPMTINLPSLEDRPLNERLEFIETFFMSEASNVKVPIRIHKDVIRAFLLYDCYGNIGQLKGDIQLLCARGFLDYKTYNKKEIEINIHLLPEHIYSGLLSRHKDYSEVFELLEYGKDYYIYKPDDKKLAETINLNSFDVSDNLYKEITKKYNHYLNIGFSNDKISEIINNDIIKYLKKLLKKYDHNTEKALLDKNELFKIINPKVYNAAETALILAEQKLNKHFSNRAIIGLAMHISALMERIADKSLIYYEEINKIALNNPSEFKVAKMIREVLQQELGISIPTGEIGFLTMFLSAVDTGDDYSKIGVIVLAHGEATATSIADVANTLLATEHCKAIDMPLDMKVDNALEKTIEMVKKVDEGKGVLLLVDMGSLTAFAEIITQKANVLTKSIENISTPIVIEAVRKSLLPEMTLSVLVEDLNRANPYIGRIISGDIKNRVNISSSKTILTTCISGMGAAVKIAQLLKNTLNFVDEYNVKIQPVNKAENLDNILDKNGYDDVIAVVGTVDLHIPQVPFIPIDELIIGDGVRKLEKSITGSNNYIKSKKQSEENVFINMLEELLTFLNPIKAYNVVNDSYTATIKLLGIKDSARIKSRYIFHNCCMIERLIQNDILPYNNIDELIQKKMSIYEKVKLSLANIEEAFGITVPDTEIGYIIDLLDTQ